MNGPLFRILCVGLFAVSCLLVLLPQLAAQEPACPGVLHQEYLFEEAPFPSCHASTICEAKDGLVAAWFGGSREGAADVGIWLARHVDGKWTQPTLVADGIISAEPRLPCWNPVLFQVPDGELLLFYKVGPSPSNWWGMVKRSRDGGGNWSEAMRLPDRHLGPVRNKPLWVAGQILCGSSTEDDGWQIHFERFSPEGEAIQRMEVDGQGELNTIQPTLLRHSQNRIQALCRSGSGCVVETWSDDGGASWSPLQKTELPNPNAGIDGVTLSDGRQLLVYNHTLKDQGAPRAREMLNVAVSQNGKDWKAAGVLERGAGEYSYPAVIQTSDGRVHVTYTHERKRIKHVVLDPSKLELKPIISGRWPE